MSTTPPFALPCVGDSASLSKTFTAQYIEEFGRLSGDANPLHVDESYAARSRFGRTIAQGMLVASLISGVIGTKLPGPGSIYISQTLEFLAPVFPGHTVTATVTITSMRPDKPIATLHTVCTNDAGAVVVLGDAVVLVNTTEPASAA